MTSVKFRMMSFLVAVAMGASFSAYAGSATFNFDSDPSATFEIDSNNPEPWKASGGNPASGGFLSITDSVNSQYTQVLFPDFDKGLIVKAFTFECDLRIGNAVGNDGRPADGFSINYARANDPVVQALIASGGPGAGTSGYAAGGAPETGTTTGIAISFDTWSGNALPDGPDIEGIIVRVDNKTVLRQGMPTRNGACDDVTSLQTGPYTPDTEGSPDGLCWQKLKVELADSGELTVTYKGSVLLNKFQTGFAPSAGRLVFAGRTGGANENHHVDNVKITTFPADKALYGGGSADAEGYTLIVSDSGQSVLDQASIKVKIDDVEVTPTSITKDGSSTTIRVVTAPNYLASGSTHKTEVTFKDTQGNALGSVRNITVASYVELTPDMKSTGVSTASSNRGMLLRTWYLANEDGTPLPDQANNNTRAEAELWGELGPNRIDAPAELDKSIPGTANKYVVAPYLNHDQSGTDQGMFSSAAADAQRQAPELPLPGIAPADLNNLACEALFFVEFAQPGLYTFGCNSDDGFRLYAGKNPLDRYQVGGKTLGEFNDGRGTDANNPQSLFQFLVREAGIYSMRYVWYEGGGGANFEVYQRLANGSLALLNDTDRAANVVKTYWAGPRTERANITKVGVPAGFNDPIEFAVTDGDTKLVDGSVKLQVRGKEVQATVSKSGATTTVKWAPPAGSTWITGPNSAQLVYEETGGAKRDQAASFAFNPRASVLPSNSFSIEAEHFDNNGAAVAGIAGKDYSGAEYDGLGAVHDVDYHENGNTPDSDLYRQGESPNAPMDSQTAAAPDLDTARPGFEVTTNYKIGWTEAGEWLNYTRTIPAGLYTAYSANSRDSTTLDLGGTLGLVTAGAGTANQTVKTLGEFHGSGSTGWGNNVLVPLANPTTGDAYVFKLPGGKVTLRYTKREGDFDWFTLSPVSGIPPKVVSAPGALDTSKRTVQWVIENFSTSVQVSSIKIEIHGADASSLVDIAATADGATITAKAPGLPPGIHSYKITYSDGSKTYEYASTMNIGPLPAAGVFLIEAEDFNFDGGKTKSEASAMPYKGGAYDGLSAVVNVDYGSNDGNDSDVYRKSENPNKNINDNLGGRLGKDRGEWEVTSNYKLGWVDTADWGNYTRKFPEANYEVWAALSFDGRGADQLRGTLGLVDNPASTSQVVTPVGMFKAPGSGGWGANNLVLMTDEAGAKKVVAMGGDQTVRFTMDSGDFDYLLFVPTSDKPAGGPKFSGITLGADGKVTISWEGGGTLQAAPSITGPWQDVAGATSPYSFTPSEKMLFGRVRQ